MLRTVIATNILLLWVTSASGQELGSAAAYNIMADAAYEETVRQSNWQSDTKLSIKKLPADLPLPENDSLDITKLKVGDVGKLEYFRFKVLSIHDEDEVLLRCGDIQSIWLKGIPTTKLVSDQYVRLCGLVKITETRSYEAVLGSRTVPQVEFLDGEELQKEEKRLADQRFERDSRTWTDKSGKFTIEAIYRGYENLMVTLEKRDGSQIEVKLSSLSSADNRWMRDQIKKEREAAKKADQ